MKRSASSATYVLLLLCLVLPAAIHRVYLTYSPYTNFNPFGYNVPHLFTGVLLMTIGGLPLAARCAMSQARPSLFFAAVFAVGVSLALDEWVYLIATDGTDDEYLAPISWWGSGIAIAAAAVYWSLLSLRIRRR